MNAATIQTFECETGVHYNNHNIKVNNVKVNIADIPDTISSTSFAKKIDQKVVDEVKQNCKNCMLIDMQVSTLKSTPEFDQQQTVSELTIGPYHSIISTIVLQILQDKYKDLTFHIFADQVMQTDSDRPNSTICVHINGYNFILFVQEDKPSTSKYNDFGKVCSCLRTKISKSLEPLLDRSISLDERRKICPIVIISAGFVFNMYLYNKDIKNVTQNEYETVENLFTRLADSNDVVDFNMSNLLHLYFGVKAATFFCERTIDTINEVLKREIVVSSNHKNTPKAKKRVVNLNYFRMNDKNYEFSSYVASEKLETVFFQDEFSGKTVVVKFIDKQELHTTQIAHQVSSKTFQSVVCADCSSIQSVHDSFKYDFMLVMDFFPTLHKYCSRTNNKLDNAILIMKQLLQGIIDYHSNCFMHRDIKLSNILINTQTMAVSFIDFGLSVTFAVEVDDIAYLDLEEQQPINDIVGTENYIAPEIYNSNGYGTKIDVYSCGVCFVQILASVVCRFEEFSKATAHIELSNVVDLFEDKTISDFKVVVMEMLENQPVKRCSAQRAYDMLIAIEMSKNMDTSSIQKEVEPVTERSLSKKRKSIEHVEFKEHSLVGEFHPQNKKVKK